jgi:hypothetical protein
MSSGRRSRFSESNFLLLAVACAAALRLDFLFAANFVLDGDEAIVGLMAKHIVEGGQVPIFYYGQHYMGSLEAILVSGLFSLMGVSTVALKAVPFLFSLALVPLVYRLGREITGEFGARVATILIAIPPSPLVIWSSMARGGFIELVVIGVGAMLLLCRWLKAPRAPVWGTVCIGGALGLGWWVNFQIIYFVGPIGLFMLCHLLRSGAGAMRRIAVHLGVGIVAFIVGSLPFWIYNLEHSFVSFEMFESAKEGRFTKHLSGFFTVALPTILGAKRFWNPADLFPGSTLLVGLLYGLTLLALVLMRRRQIVAFMRLRVDSRAPVELLLVFIVTVGVVFCASSFGFLFQAPRYLLPIYPGIFLLVGVVLNRWKRWNRSLAVALAAFIVGLNLTSSYIGGRAIPGEPFVFNGERVSRDHTELIQWLEGNDIRWVRTNYWIGYRLALETAERVRFRVFQEPEQERIEQYIEASAAFDEETMPLVLVPAQAKLVARALEFQGILFERVALSGYEVFYRLKVTRPDLKPLGNERIGKLTASSRGETAAAVLDGDLQTRWGSGTPQRPGMSFVVEFVGPVDLRGLRYHLGAFKSDYPRLLDVELQLANGETRRIVEKDDSVALRYYSGPITLTFPRARVRGVKFTQLGRDRVFDWSIAELQFFE